MLITAKFASTCLACGLQCNTGDRVAWTPGTRGVRHAACSDEGKAVVAAVETSRAVDAAIAVPAPDGLEYLGYQKAGIAYAIARQSTLIADEMGLGKTIQAIGVINATNPKSVLVVCPASLKYNWKRELQRWLVKPYGIQIVGDKDDPHGLGEYYILVVNYEQLKKIDKRSFDLLIVDEAQACKNAKSQRTKAVGALAKHCQRKLFLTGTPLMNGRPVELFPILEMVNPEGLGKAFTKYAWRYCDPKKVFFGRRSAWDFTGSARLDELQEKLRSTCMVRRLKADVLTELPPKRRQVISLETVEADELVKSVPNDYDDAVATLSGKKVAFERYSAVRHEDALKKVPKALEWLIEQLGEPGDTQKVVIFAHHKDVLDALEDGLADYGIVRIDGDTPKEDRLKLVDEFQTIPDTRVALCSLKAAGVGLTLTAASWVVFVELDWTPANVSQAEDRCHRIGQKDSVLIHHLIVDGTLDGKMARMLVEKQNLADMALDVEASYTNEGKRKVEPPSPVDTARVWSALLRLKYLAARCDGARELDGMGFNGVDTNVGKSLSRLETMSSRQLALAEQMLVKYQKQLREGGFDS